RGGHPLLRELKVDARVQRRHVENRKPWIHLRHQPADIGGQRGRWSRGADFEALQILVRLDGGVIGGVRCLAAEVVIARVAHNTNDLESPAYVVIEGPALTDGAAALEEAPRHSLVDDAHRAARWGVPRPERPAFDEAQAQRLEVVF